jgi:hypothetical protein
MNFIKANLWKLLAMVVVVYLMVTGYNTLRDYLFNAGMAAAQAKYDEAIAEANARLVAKNREYVALIGDAERKRQEVKAAHELEIRKFKSDIGYFRSETAAALRAKKATTEQWAAEKTKDEVTINLQAERIEALDLSVESIMADWKASDDRKDAAHKAVVDELTTKFTRCEEWTTTLEEKIKRKPLGNVLQVGAVVTAFVLGRII